jgi:leucyl aminopeptidase
MGGYLSVQAGSAFEPQLIHLVYRGERDSSGSGSNAVNSKPFRAALVGKGLTFDSGGYNLKVSRTCITELC